MKSTIKIIIILWADWSHWIMWALMEATFNRLADHCLYRWVRISVCADKTGQVYMRGRLEYNWLDAGHSFPWSMWLLVVNRECAQKLWPICTQLMIPRKGRGWLIPQKEVLDLSESQPCWQVILYPLSKKLFWQKPKATSLMRPMAG